MSVFSIILICTSFWVTLSLALFKDDIANECNRCGEQQAVAQRHGQLQFFDMDMNRGGIDEGTFREDLWFRLNVFPIFIPPLRQRPEDIPDLTLYFLREKAKEMNLPIPEIEPGTFERLAAYRWRGNVRELENVIERTLIRHRGGLLRINPGGESAPTTAPPVNAAQSDAPRFHWTR
jgi:transcriptional regulator with AAA-type ATPase domain